MVVHRAARKGAPVRRISGATLNALCTTLGVQPGDLLAYLPDKKPKRR